jgi:hypothetical protein
MTTRYIDETVVAGKRLGRHVNHDPRSLAYPFARTAEPKSVSWPRRIPILDQGNLGSCTGNALVGALGTDPDYETLVATIQTTLTESLAVEIYSAAEKIDGGAGYPPEDEGSSGLSVAKAAKNMGLLSGYQHITSVSACHAAIQTGPFIVGSDWYEGFDSPDSSGVVKISGNVRGGHEYECHAYDASADLWWFANSWGTSYGKSGYFAYDTSTLSELLSSDGDATVLIPITQPAPVPVPTPTPTPAVDADVALVAAGDAWEPSILSRFTKAGKFKIAFDAWKVAKGYK